MKHPLENPYFDVYSCTREVFGFFEEYADAETGYCYGTRRIEGLPDRPMGYAGRREFTITENMTVKRGPKDYVIKASPKAPRRIAAMLQALCGRTKERA